MPQIEEGIWTLNVPKIGKIKFKSTQHGRLGIKVISKPSPPPEKTYKDPTTNEDATVIRAKYDPVARRYFLESEAQIKVRHKETGQEITWEQFKTMNPKTKEASVVKMVDANKVYYNITDTMSSYFLIPVNDYDNIIAYNQFVFILKQGVTAITSPIRLAEGSDTIHVYALFADTLKQGLIAVEFLKKEGMREHPPESVYEERQIARPEQIARARTSLYKERFLI